VDSEQRPQPTQLGQGDVVEIITGDNAEPNPAWLSFVKTGRARSKIRHHLKTLAHEKSNELGERMLTQALRSEGIATLPSEMGEYKATWDKLLRFTGNKTRSDLLSDIGMGKRIASMVGKKLAVLL
jgi:GTP pyrophosphokinase